jgi:hypothetical protein
MKWFQDERLRNDRIMFGANVAAALINVAWALAFPNYFTFLNWLVAGVSGGTAMCQITMAKQRLMVEDQTATILAQSAAMDAISPAQMRTMLQAALAEVVAQLKRDGTIPADAEITITQDNLPKSLH